MQEQILGIEETEELTQEKWDLIVSRVVSNSPWVASLDEFIQKVFAKDALKNGETGLPVGLILGVEKFKRPGDTHYRLIWIGRRKAALAAENTTKFRRKLNAVMAGHVVAAETGAHFDEQTR